MDWPRAVLFDLDGTLIDSAPMIAEALNRVIAERGGEAVAVECVQGLVSRGVAELVATCLGTCATDSSRDIDAFRTVYRTLSPQESDLYPGVRKMLAGLRAEGCKLAICTNKPQALTEGILAALALAPLFDVVVGGDTATKAKPHPDHVYDVLDRLGVAPSDAVYIGDSEVDAEAAAAAGVPLVLVTFGYALGPLENIPHAVRIGHFGDLLVVLGGLHTNGRNIRV